MTDGEKAIAYCEEYAKENNLASLQNVSDFIEEAFIAGMAEGRNSYNKLVKAHEERVEKLKREKKLLEQENIELNNRIQKNSEYELVCKLAKERNTLLEENKHLQELVDTLHAVLEDTKKTLTSLVGD